MRSRPLALLAALVAATGFAACGDDDNDSSTTGTEAAQSQPADTASTPDASTETSTTATGSGTTAADIKVSPTKDLSEKPRIPKQAADPPSQLIKQDIVVGKGRTAKEGDVVSMQYVGVRYRDNQQFDASWDRGEPFQFPLGGGQVIQGWDQGIVGMKVGGRRQLTIPPDLAYGDQGAGPDIAPGETLIFVVDLKKIDS